MDLISVIVPVYKVEAYLDRCVQSIVDQTYTNLEIILVDDGSPDNCPAMCDAWAARDSRIKVIHKENGGLSDARNAGMAIAAGEYIGFVDSDDYISPEMYRLLLEHIYSDNSDITACGVEMVWEDGTSPRKLTPDGNCVLEHEAAMEACIQENWLKQPVWYKLYKTELVRDIPFPVGKYHEDVFWTWQAVAQAQHVSIFDTPCYKYIQRDGSIMAENYSLRRLDAIEAKEKRHSYIKESFPDLTALSLKELWFSCIYQGQLSLREMNREGVNQTMEYLQGVLGEHPCNVRGYTAKEKMWLFLARISLRGVCQLRNALKIGI